MSKVADLQADLEGARQALHLAEQRCEALEERAVAIGEFADAHLLFLLGGVSQPGIDTQNRLDLRASGWPVRSTVSAAVLLDDKHAHLLVFVYVSY